MHLSTKGRYAVMAMIDLATQNSGGAAALAGVAERQQLSLTYLEQLFARLRKRGLVRSVRGPGGGYQLGRPAAEISIAEVVIAVDEPLKATRCSSGEGPNGSGGCMKGGARCITHDLWETTGQVLQTYLASVSLDDVVAGRLKPESARAA